MNKTSSVTVLGFEGPEKRLEVDFKVNPNRPDGLRVISKEEWQDMLDLAKCTIISQKSNDFFDSFVLSESSLFVWPNKMMIKTCGTTTLLHILPKLLEYSKRCELQIDLVIYSRKNFLFPQQQQYPHGDWRDETDYLDQYFDGQSYILGPITKDHWFLYLADYTALAPSSFPTSKEITLEIMMHNLDPSAASQFYRKEETGDRDKFPGVAELIPGTDTDEFNFTPCGYSMNGLADDVYSTIHVTPEPHCSYASYETNVSLTNYNKLIANVFAIFKPGTVTLSLFAERSNASTKDCRLEIPGYILRNKTYTDMGENCEVVVCNYESAEFALQKRRRPSIVNR